MIDFKILYDYGTKSISTTGVIISNDEDKITIIIDAEPLDFKDELQWNEFWRSHYHELVFDDNHMEAVTIFDCTIVKGAAVLIFEK